MNALPPSTIYEDVVHKKIVGSLALTDQSMVFHSDVNSANGDGVVGDRAPFSWSIISKHQVSPVKHPKALLKLLMVDGRSNTFQFRERSELDRIRRDITTRLQRYKANRPNEAAASESMSDKNDYNLDQSTMSPQQQQAPPTVPDSSFGNVDASSEGAARTALLAKNSQLRSQHHFLVEETKTLSEEEFWDKNHDLIEEEFARMGGKARTGLSSALQSNLQILNGRITLGVEEMRQIFILYPSVHKAYEEKVPSELSDEEFWKKYLHSEYFHRNRIRLAGSDNTNGADGSSDSKLSQKSVSTGTAGDLFSNYDRKLQAESTDKTAKRKWGTNLAVGQFDLASTYETDRGSLLEGPKDNHPSADDGKGSQVIQKYNRHWAMVMHPDQAEVGSDLMQVARKSALESDPNDSDAKAGGGTNEEMCKLVNFAKAGPTNANHALGTGVEDLDNYEMLTLRNVQRYSQAPHDATSGSEVGTKEAIELIVTKVDAMAASILNKNRQEESQRLVRRRILDDAFPAPDDGRKELLRLSKRMAEDAKSDADALEVVNTLPDDFKKRLHSYFRRSSELLRHFFGLRRLAGAGFSKHPSSDSSSIHADTKINRIVQVMDTLYREMAGHRKGFEQDSIMAQMWDQVMDQLNWALTLHGHRVRNGRCVDR